MRRVFDRFSNTVAAVAVILLAVNYSLPNSLWFRIDRIHVMDSRVGEPPKIIVAREIMRPFRGHWIVTVKKAIDESEPSSYFRECTSSGESDYRPETVLPPNLNLDWWTVPIKCDLQSGTYIVDTAWEFQGFLSKRTVRQVSNVFIVN